MQNSPAFCRSKRWCRCRWWQP